MAHEYVLYVSFVASKIVLRLPNRDASKNVSTPTISEFNEILRASYISRDDSNGEIRFIIRDLENKFRIFNLNYNFLTKITILPFFQKLEFLGSYKYFVIPLRYHSLILWKCKCHCWAYSFDIMVMAWLIILEGYCGYCIQ